MIFPTLIATAGVLTTLEQELDAASIVLRILENSAPEFLTSPNSRRLRPDRLLLMWTKVSIPSIYPVACID